MTETQKGPQGQNPGGAPTQAAKPAGPQAAGTAPKTSASLLDRIKAQVAAMKPEEVQAELTKLRAQREKQKKYQGKYSELSPEAKKKRQEYNKKRMADPGVKAKQKAYRESPATKAKQKAYRKVRAERQKMLLAKAESLGITI